MRLLAEIRCRKIMILGAFLLCATMLMISVSRVSYYQNPGCGANNLSAYRPMSGVKYYHPNVVHFMKLYRDAKQGDSGSFNFLEYVSMLSFYTSLHPDKIFVHSNLEMFSGYYWNKLRRLTYGKIVLLKIEIPSTIEGKRWTFVEHVADYLKLLTVEKYGGIATDFDVFVLNGRKFAKQQKTAECVLSCEGYNCMVINAGFYSCAKHTSYVKSLIQTYKTDYHPDEWLYNAGYVPTALLMSGRTCHDVLVDHTIVGDPYKDDSNQWQMPGGVKWKGRSIIHITVRNFHKMILDEETIMNGNSSFSELIRSVLVEKSNFLDNPENHS